PLVQPRPIAVVVAVHRVGIVRLTQLDEAAAACLGVALHQFDGAGLNLFVGSPGKHTGERLTSQMQDRVEVSAAADPAALNRRVAHVWLPWVHERERVITPQPGWRGEDLCEPSICVNGRIGSAAPRTAPPEKAVECATRPARAG